MRRTITRPLLLIAVTLSLFAQQPLRFEAASVKMRQPGSRITAVGGEHAGPRLNFEAMTLAGLAAWAWDIKGWQIAGGPPWAGSSEDAAALDPSAKRFDIKAKAEGEAARSNAEFRQMLIALLLERFHLTFHRESRDTAVYALVADKGGPKFRESGPDATGVLRMPRSGYITASGGTMSQLVGWLSNRNGVDRPVVDQTGLAGRYDYTLEWSNPLAGAEQPDAKPDATAPAIFTAVREQPGLRLEPRRAPMEVMVIDRAELPDEN
ncbi:MAG TPA: TIGR03435 family protein [Bryobacteraceae bacterium]|nr:TIGR03435 family protein [Bryobacteraceae bacterium]